MQGRNFYQKIISRRLMIGTGLMGAAVMKTGLAAEVQPSAFRAEPEINSHRRGAFPPPRKIVAVGHRGTKKFAPENTIIAHETAYRLGARAIEFDVRCTKDGHFVVIHDPIVNRTTDGSGWVHNMTLSQIKALDAGHYKGAPFNGTRVPTLREALRNVRGRFAVDIDFKGGPSDSADRLAKILEEEGPFDHLITIFVRKHHFDMLKSLSWKYALRPHFVSSRHTLDWVANYPLRVMGLRRRSFSFDTAHHIRQVGLHLFSNVMGRHDNERGFEDAVRANSLFIQSDHLDHLVAYLADRNLLETGVIGQNFQPLPGTRLSSDSTQLATL